MLLEEVIAINSELFQIYTLRHVATGAIGGQGMLTGAWNDPRRVGRSLGLVAATKEEGCLHVGTLSRAFASWWGLHAG